MAVERGGHDTDDGNQFDVAGSLAAGTEHRPKHRNVVYRHPAGGFQPKPFLSPAIELTPEHSTFGTRNDRPTQNTLPTVVVCGPVVQRSMVRPRDGICLHSLRQPVALHPGRGAAGADTGI